MSEQPSFSVIIPAYNSHSTLARAIDSVLAQTLPALEVLVVDDGSTDDTRAIAEGYGPPVRCIHKPNGGVASARNRGIREARGDWVALLDADDVWLPHKLQEQWDALQRAPGVGWAACRHDIIRDGRRWRQPIRPKLQAEIARNGTVPSFNSMHRLPFQTSGLVVRRDLLHEVGLFQEWMRVADDRDLMWRIALRQPRVAYTTRVSHEYRCDTPGSLTKQPAVRREEVLQSLCNVLREAERLSPEARESFYPVGRGQAYNLMLRLAGKDLPISPEVRRDALAAFRLNRWQQATLWVVRALPVPLGRRLADWICWCRVRHRMPQARPVADRS